MGVFRMIVEYDGTRYRGFQRQSSSTVPSSLLVGGGETSTTSNKKNGTPAPLSSTRKRARTQKDGHKEASTYTIQECLESAICHWLNIANVKEIALRYAGRTDKGVHAKGQVIAVTLPDIRVAETATDNDNNNSSINNNDNNNENHDGTTQTKVQKKDGDNNKSSDGTTTTATTITTTRMIRQSINSRLPRDISVSSVAALSLRRDDNDDEFDPRRDVVRKEYSYTIKYRTSGSSKQCGSGVKQNASIESFRGAFDSSCVWLCPWLLNDGVIPSVCKQLEGMHDFRNFVHKDDTYKYNPEGTHVLELKSFTFASLSRKQYDDDDDDVIVLGQFQAQAKGFRRSMVRNLVGFVVNVAATTTQTTITRNKNGISNNGNDAKHNNHSVDTSSFIDWSDIWGEIHKNNNLANDDTASCATTATKKESSDGEDTNNEKTPLLLSKRILLSKQMITAAPASGLCLEWVSYKKE